MWQFRPLPFVLCKKKKKSNPKLRMPIKQFDKSITHRHGLVIGIAISKKCTIGISKKRDLNQL
jgi:hypothetical protein